MKFFFDLVKPERISQSNVMDTRCELGYQFIIRSLFASIVNCMEVEISQWLFTVLLVCIFRFQIKFII